MVVIMYLIRHGVLMVERVRRVWVVSGASDQYTHMCVLFDGCGGCEHPGGGVPGCVGVVYVLNEPRL